MLTRDISFDKEFQALNKLISTYSQSTSFLHQHGTLGRWAAEALLNRIETTCATVEDPQSKLYIMHEIINDFIVTGVSHDMSLVESGMDADSLRGRLIGFIDSEQKLTEPEIKKYVHELSQKLHNTLADESISLRAAQDRQALNIPEEGVSVRLHSRLSDAPLKRTIKDQLYSPWKLLSNKEGFPVDMHGKVLSDGWYDYVILKNNEVRFLPTHDQSCGHLPYIKYRSHSQLADGRRVYAAGNFYVLNNTVVKIDGASGHYGTEANNYVLYAKLIFSYAGINMNHAESVVDQYMSGSYKWGRFKRKTVVFFKALFLEKGEIAESKPSPPVDLIKKIPSF